MSAPREGAFGGDDIAKVLEMAVEPSFMSEIGRKLRNNDPEWSELTENNAIGRAVSIVSFLDEERDDAVEVVRPFSNYDGTEGQAQGSPHQSIVDGETNTWEEYAVARSLKTDYGNVREEFKGVVDPDVTIETKFDIIDTLSSRGNDVSKDVENVAQDLLERQFRFYDDVEVSDYNNPGLDFYVRDERDREYGLAVEVSTRWVNPIGKNYVEAKRQKATERDMDLVILAPRFSQIMLEKYENPDEVRYNADPLAQMVHLHRVPRKEPEVYKPFAKKPGDISDEERNNPTGNPVITPDGNELRDRLNSDGHVGNNYPVVDSRYGSFRSALDTVGRDYRSVTESMYRNQFREAIEPLLWQFLRPYRIEQFLVDLYWDRGLTQDEIGSLVDRNKGTIGRWMDSEHWDLVTSTRSNELRDETIKLWVMMYEGIPPFLQEHSGYRIQAEWNRHPLWGIDDWEEYYAETNDSDREELMASQDSYRENIDYTVLLDPETGLNPSYNFILSVIRGRNNDRVGDIIDDLEEERDVTIDRGEDGGVQIREPDTAPRVPYSAYPSRTTLDYMINRDEDTIVEVENG